MNKKIILLAGVLLIGEYITFIGWIESAFNIVGTCVICLSFSRVIEVELEFREYLMREHYILSSPRFIHDKLNMIPFDGEFLRSAQMGETVTREIMNVVDEDLRG